eukprot:CAMPEP_0197173196 /NCGR_PEP_ID=MMETSP1423-20130617/224_1 /TAXON_ID=476441 /ORGANISM="Pseudo-nitzschia heimii, Strain UNC1101" /LENGTH=85 /DNA_ID=CAMNT_0042621977 /DNA_START=43 /DNA_END=297 /DNA_ORIENTATION=-
MTAAWLPADLPLSLHYKSREGGVIAKHCARRYTLLVQLLLILVGFWVGIRVGILPRILPISRFPGVNHKPSAGVLIPATSLFLVT